MARLAAVEKMLYYPTPSRMTDLIAQSVTWDSRCESLRLLDVCAGEGTAAASLAAAWEMDAYGVELDGGRAALAAQKITCLHGSYHQLHAPEGSFSCLFLNPPYDTGESDGVSTRQEVQFLMDCTGWLAPGGLLVFVVPRHILDLKAYQEWMQRQYNDVVVHQFPQPEYEAFKQVVVFARRASSSWSYSTLNLPDELPLLGEGVTRVVYRPTLVTLTDFKLAGFDPVSLAPSYEPENATWGYASATWDMLVGPRGDILDQPLMAPRPGHQAMLLAAGALDGAEICGGTKLLKGGSEKIVVTSEEPSTQKGMVTIVERERIVSRLSVLDLATGDYETWRADQEPDKTAAWFQDHGPDLARAIQTGHTPAFNGELTPYAGKLATLTAPGILPGRTTPEILLQQQEAAAAITFRWNKQRAKSVLLSGEQGIGKTTVATVSCELAGHKKVIVICPTHLVKKWIRECETITGQQGIAVTAKKLSEVDAFFTTPDEEIELGVLALFNYRPVVPRYLILSKEIAKLGSRWEPRFTTKTVLVEREVPDHNATPTYSYNYGYRYGNPTPIYPTKKIKEPLEVVTCPDCNAVQMDGEMHLRPASIDAETQRLCSNKKCKTPLWQYVPLTAKGTTRWPLARYIRQRYSRRYACIVDECHQYSKSDSDQSRAVQDLASGATKILAMTGTLYGGRASSIFHLLFKIDAGFREAYNYKDCDRFVAHHGLFEERREERESTSVYGYRRGKAGGRIKEIPGMSPAMIPMLLPYTIFLKLRDLQLELPPYSEHVELVDHEPEISQALTKLQGELKAVLRKHPRVLGQYLQACLGYPDCPEQDETIIDHGEDGDKYEVLATAPAFGAHVLPKDQRLVDIVKVEKAAGRRVLVFCTQTHKRDARMRLKAALEAEGLKVVVLEASVAAEKREEFVIKSVATGFDVMITNGKLVETGLDLLFANTIIQFGTEYSIPTLRQSIRRSWRLGQSKPVKVIFLAYRGTMQDTALTLIAKKSRAAEMVDGDEAGGLSQHDEGGTNFLLELAHQACLAA